MSITPFMGCWNDGKTKKPADSDLYSESSILSSQRKKKYLPKGVFAD